jgi:hypothetical protein
MESNLLEVASVVPVVGPSASMPTELTTPSLIAKPSSKGESVRIWPSDAQSMAADWESIAGSSNAPSRGFISSVVFEFATSAAQISTRLSSKLDAR